MLENLCQNIRIGRIPPRILIDESCECIFVDCFDNIAGKQAATNEVKRILRNSEYNESGNKGLIICVFVDEKVAENFAMLLNDELIYVEHVNPNLRVVRDKTKEFDIRLSDNRMRKYAKFDAMFELRQAFREVERDAFFSEYAVSKSKIEYREQER